MLDVVARIPRGAVMTYGDVAEYLGAGGPRVVGNVLRLHGREVPWWRVLLASGHPAPSNPAEARTLLRSERVPFLPGGERVDLRLARWDGRPGFAARALPGSAPPRSARERSRR